MRIAESVTQYLAVRYVAGCRAKTLSSYRCVLHKFAEHLRSMKITDTGMINPDAFRCYLAQRRKEGKQSTTLRTERRILLGYVKWLCTTESLGEFDWAKEVPQIRIDRKCPRWLSPEECRKLLDVATNVIYHREELSRRRDIAMLALLLDTGLRESELLRIRLSDIDWTARSIRVCAEAKGRRERRVWFSAQAAKLCQAYLKIRPESKDGQDWLWLTRTRTKMSPTRLYMIVTAVARVAGLSRVHVHAMRHTAGTLMLRNMMPTRMVQSILGHSRIATTERYLHLIDDDIGEKYLECAPLDRLLKESA